MWEPLTELVSERCCPWCNRRLSGGWGFRLPEEQPLCPVRCAGYRGDMEMLGIERPRNVAERLAEQALQDNRPYASRY